MQGRGKRARLQVEIDADVDSLDTEEKLSYDKQVLKIYNDYEESVFNLSEQSNNETIESIKNMSLGQRVKFQKLITARNKRLNTRKKDGQV